MASADIAGALDTLEAHGINTDMWDAPVTLMIGSGTGAKYHRQYCGRTRRISLREQQVTGRQVRNIKRVCAHCCTGVGPTIGTWRDLILIADKLAAFTVDNDSSDLNEVLHTLDHHVERIRQLARRWGDPTTAADLSAGADELAELRRRLLDQVTEHRGVVRNPLADLFATDDTWIAACGHIAEQLGVTDQYARAGIRHNWNGHGEQIVEVVANQPRADWEAAISAHARRESREADEISKQLLCGPGTVFDSRWAPKLAEIVADQRRSWTDARNEFTRTLCADITADIAAEFCKLIDTHVAELNDAEPDTVIVAAVDGSHDSWHAAGVITRRRFGTAADHWPHHASDHHLLWYVPAKVAAQLERADWPTPQHHQVGAGISGRQLETVIELLDTQPHLFEDRADYINVGVQLAV